MKIRSCSNCLMLETRPRITFNELGECNACAWAKEKKEEVDWVTREAQMVELVKQAKERNPGGFEFIFPASGGKDSSYGAYQMKHKWGINGLSVTIHPPMSYALGNQNLENFIFSGFDNIDFYA